MKKLIIICLWAVVCTFSAQSQQWVNFSSSEPCAPELNLLTSNAQTVTFSVTIPGIYTVDTVVKGMAFTRLILPGGSAINPTGSPELPVLTYRVAIPVCDDAEVTCRIDSKQTMPSCWVYPVPEMVLDGNGNPVEQFSFNSVAYAQPRIIEPAAVVSYSGSLRAQRYVEVTFQPVEFCPVTRQLSVIDQVEITLTFSNPQGELRQNVGIFNKVAATAFMNYEDNGISALIHDKAFEKKGFTPGNVQWITLTDTAQASQIVCDYLIITVPEFFNSQNADLKRLAEHRAFYNGYDVAIINVNDIFLLNFSYANPIPKFINEQKMRTFIRRVYEGKNALHTGDSCLAYVLLIGDNYEDNTGMPTGLEHGWQSWTINPTTLQLDLYYSDYYFSCITGDALSNPYNPIGDLFIGRFSVENETQLFNMVQKTIYYETEYSPDPWRKTAGFTYSQDSYNGYDTVYCNYMSNLLNDCGWNGTIVNGVTLNGAVKIPTLNYLNAGATFVQYLGKQYGDLFSDSWNDDLTQSYLLNELSNEYKTPFVCAIDDYTGRFDDYDGMGEFLTRYDSIRGAVGCIGASRGNAFLLSMSSFQGHLSTYLLNDTISIAGELLLITKLSSAGSLIIQDRYAYNLLGDPALNIMAEGYDGCRRIISDQMQVLNGDTLTVPDDCILYLYQNGKLIIEEDGVLTLGNRAQIIGVHNETDTIIHVKGGEFIVGDSIIFQDLSGGILFENKKNTYKYKFAHSYVVSKQFDFRNTTFNNTPLRNHQTLLNISNCTFNQESNVETSKGVIKIDSCTFNNSTFTANNAVTSSPQYDNVPYPYPIISNTLFIGNNNNNNNTALKMNHSNDYCIWNNSITGYQTGISLTECGLTLFQNAMSPARIYYNTVSSCDAGVTLYNSVGGVIGNTIYDNYTGINLYNNCYTVFDNFYFQTTVNQIISDNISYQLYASQDAFPTQFHYNIIQSSLNNGVPFIYWDILPPYKEFVQDITFNCWGENFDSEEDLYPSEAFVWAPAWDCTGKSGSSIHDEDETLFQSALSYFAEEDYSNAETTFKELIETYPQSRFAIAALHELFALEYFQNNDFATLYEYYASFTPADSNLFNVAEFLATRCHVKAKNWQPAIDWYEYRIENPPTYQDSVFAVIDLGDIHLMMEADSVGSSGTKSGAAICHYRLAEVKPKSKQAYEENKTTLLATLPQIKKPQTENPQNPHALTQNDKKGSLGQNMPNPVTGTTIITYELYTEGAVEIKIYNASGQLIKTLSQGTCKQGSHHTDISLADYATGLYYYALFVNGERTDAKKLVVTN